MKSCHCILLAALLLGACASSGRKFDEGRNLLAEGQVEAGLARLEEATQDSPGNAEYRAYLVRQRERIVNQLLALANAARLDGRHDEAEALVRRAEGLDPKNQRIAAALAALAADRRHRDLLREADALLPQGEADKAAALARRVLAENPRQREAKALLKRIEERQLREAAGAPKLKSTLKGPITLEFRDANLKAVFEVISRSAGINFVFDKDVKADLKTTLFVKNAPVEDAIQLLLASNQLEKKLLSESSVMVYPNTPAKQRDYQELVMKSFYLANADVKQAGNMLKAMLKTRDVFVDERLNLLMVRDTPEAIRLAEKLIASQDLAEPEAVLEVEVLEVSRGRLEAIGIQWPKQLGYGILQGGTTTQSTTGGVVIETTTPGQTVATGVVDLHRRNGLTTFIANPALLLNLNAQDTAANVLANPRIRVRNREKAKIHIGDKVPVLTSTATSTGFVSQSITYLDVGVKLDVEPTVGLDDDVTMKVGLEVSSIAREITNSAGTVAYQVGTRAAGTTLRLKDGETQVLAGLIQDEDRRNASKIPGLGDLPVLGRLFSSNSDTFGKTEIVLLITPHIVRNLNPPSAGNSEFSAGTESSLGRPGFSESSPEYVADQAPPGAVPQGGIPPGAEPGSAVPAPLPVTPAGSTPGATSGTLPSGAPPLPGLPPPLTVPGEPTFPSAPGR